jgi:hypothetical protein
MSDEYHARYAHLSHQDLYRMLKAGDPGRIDSMAAGWTVLQERADSLASALAADLQRLSRNWSSASGQEYQRRVGLAGQFSTQLGEDFGIMRDELAALGSDLRQAQAKAEDPAHTTNHMATDAATGAMVGSFAGPVGVFVAGTIGAIHGHAADEEEKEKAHQRMIQLVADLAASYDMVRTGRWSVDPVAPPTDLPGSSRSGTSAASMARVSSGTRAAGVGGVGTVAGPGRHRTPDPSDAGAVPELGPDGAAASSTADPSHLSGTSLAGAGTALLGAGLVDTAALDLALNRGQPGGSTGGVSGSLNPATEGVIGADGRGATGGKAVSGLSRTGLAGEHASAGTGRRGYDDKADEHLTWLTEDDMVWGNGEAAAPAVVGGVDPAEEPADR